MAQRQFRSDDTSGWSDAYGFGADGAKVVSSSAEYDGAKAGCAGTAAATALTIDAATTFANGDAVIIHQSRGTGVGAWELNRIASGGGTTSLTMAYPLINTYTNSGASQAQIVELKQYTSVTVDASQTWSAPAWDQNTGGILAFLCSGTTTITGIISASAKGFLQGNPDNTGNPAPRGGATGEGTTGATVDDQAAANGNGGGGGYYTNNPGGDYTAGGGGGGHSAAGTTGATAGSGTGSAGTGGDAVGNAGLTSANFGGGGGGGLSGNLTGGGEGGIGGGFVLIISKRITITGSVISAGQNGATATGGTYRAGGGGGAGGAVLLKGQVVVLGSNLVSALKGSAGAGNNGAGGGDGADGRIHLDYASTVTGTTNPTLDSRQDSSLADKGGAFLFF